MKKRFMWSEELMEKVKSYNYFGSILYESNSGKVAKANSLMGEVWG